MASHSTILTWRIPWTEEPGRLQSIGFSKQEYWSVLTFLPPGDLPDPEIEPTSPLASALQADSLPLSHLGNLSIYLSMYIYYIIYIWYLMFLPTVHEQYICYFSIFKGEI